MTIGQKKAVVAMLGTLAHHKGAVYVREMCTLLQKEDWPIRFVLIGESQPSLQKLAGSIYKETGPYRAPDLHKMIKDFDPAAIFFPGRIPETFSYTLSEAMRCGIPIMAPRIGAFPERLANYPRAALYDVNANSKEVLVELVHIVHNRECRSNSSSEKFGSNDKELFATNNFYTDGDYLSGGGQLYRSDKRRKHAFVISERLQRVPSPCAYIRLIEPLTRLRHLDRSFSWCLGNVAESFDANYDFLILQRYSELDEAMLERCFIDAKGKNAKVIYDIDDDLVDIPPEHPEFTVLNARKGAVQKCLAQADNVWVSTDPLKEKFKSLTQAVSVLPNVVHPDLLGSCTFGRGRQTGDRVRVLIMGTRTHDDDFRMIEAPLRRIASRYAEEIEIIVVGMLARKVSGFGSIRFVEPTGGSVPTTYPMFMSWLSGKGPFDIGLAPLVNNSFNSCKSDIKYRDYGLLGAAPIVSRCAAYMGTVSDGFNGMLVGPDPEEWFWAMERLIREPQVRRSVQLNAWAAATDLERIRRIDQQRLVCLGLGSTSGGLVDIRCMPD